MNRATSLRKTYSQRSCVFTQAMERLEQFEPAIVHAGAHDAQSYALAYVEHYPGNVPQLEREREFLLAALAQAWQPPISIMPPCSTCSTCRKMGRTFHSTHDE